MKIKLIVICGFLAIQLNGLDISLDSLCGRSNVSLDDNTLTVGGNNEDTTYTGVISGSGSLVKIGSGTLTLTSANTYFGQTTITGNGAISISGDVNLGASFSPINLNNGKLVITGSFATARNLNLENQGLIETCGILNFNGDITGAGELVKLGQSILTLNSIANTYSGLTIVNEGILQAGIFNAFSPNSEVLVNSAATLDLGFFDNAIPSISGSGYLSLGSGILTVGNQNNSNFSGVVYGSGGITKKGEGVLVFSGNSTYSGQTNINQGSLTAGSVNGFSQNSSVAIGNSPNAELNLNGYDNTILNLSGGGKVILDSATLTLGDPTSQIYSGEISGSGGITYIGSGTFQLNGSANTYHGNTSVVRGVFQAGGINSFSPNSLIDLSSEAVLDLNGCNNQISNLSGSGAVLLNYGVLTVGNDNNSLFLGSISGIGGVTKLGSGTLVLSGSNTYLGNTVIQAGALVGPSVNSAVIINDLSEAELKLNGFDTSILSLSGGGKVSLDSATLSFGDSNTQVYSGSISGDGGITYIGTGTFQLNGSNNIYSGNTTIDSGAFQGGASNAFSQNSLMVINQNALLDLNGYNNVIANLSGEGSVSLTDGTLTLGSNHLNSEFSGKISGSGGITKRGRGAITLSGVNSYSGTTNIYGGLLVAGGFNALSPISTVALSSGTFFDLNGYSNIIGNLSGSGSVRLGYETLTLGGNQASALFGGEITGSGSIAKIGTGTITLSGSNSYEGVTFIYEGTLAAGARNSFSPRSEVNLANTLDASLNLCGYDNIILNLSGGGNVCLGNGTLTFGDSNTTGFLGSILGEGGITKQGSGTFILYGNSNTYSGSTIINEGAIQAGDVNVFSNHSEIGLMKAGVLDINGYSNRISNLSGEGTLILSNGILTIGNSNSRSYSGSILGTGGITKEGSGVLSLNGVNNTYSGLTEINLGAFQAGGENALSPSSKVVVNPEGLLKINGYDNTIANLSGAGNVLIVSAILNLGDKDNSQFSGSIYGSGGIAKQGSGNLILSGTNNTYSGPTIINSGTLKLAGMNVFSPNSALVLPNANGISLDLGSNNNTILSLSGIGNVALGSGILTVGDGTNTLFSGVIESFYNIGGLIKQGSGTLSFSGSNTYSGLTEIRSGTLQSLSEGSFSPYSSVLVCESGCLELGGHNNTIRSLSGQRESRVNLGTGFLKIEGNNLNTTFEGVISGSGGIIKTGAGVLTLSGDNTYSGITEISGGGTIVIQSDSNLGNSSQINLNNGTLAAIGSDFTLSTNIHIIDFGTIMSEVELTVSGGLTGSGEITKSGSGNVHLSGSENTFNGRTIILDGSIYVDGPSVFSPNSRIHLCDHSCATLNLNGNNHSISSISGSGNVNLGAANLTIGSETDSLYEGVISGSGSVTKDGVGLLSLTGDHTYTGTTTINAGTLSINGSIQSPVTIGPLGRLQGAGSINSNLVSYGTMAPGNSIGPIIVIGNVIYGPGSVVEIEVAPKESDTIYITGTLTINPGATLQIVPLAGNYPSAVSYEIITAATSPLTGSFTNVDYTVERASGSVVYSRDHPDINVTLLLNPINYYEVASGSNARSVAGVLDSISEKDVPSWSDALNNLFYLSNKELNEAYRELAPSQLKGLTIIQQNNGVRIQDSISYRFQNILDDCKNRKTRAHFWMDGIYSTLHQDSTDDDSNPLTGYHSKTGGGTVGLDVNFLNCGYVGIMGAGTSSNIHFEDDQGNANIYSGYVGLYGSYIGNGPFMNTSLLTGWNTYKATRNIVYSGVDAIANNEHSGIEFLAHLDFGWNFVCPGFKIRPFDSIDYILQHENGFHEELAGVFDLEVESTNPQMIRNELGLSFAKCFKVSKQNTLVADVKLSWVLEERFNGKKFVSNFDNLDNLTFTTDGYFPIRSLFSPGASITGNFCEDRAYITANYDAEIGDGYYDQVFIGQLGIKF